MLLAKILGGLLTRGNLRLIDYKGGIHELGDGTGKRITIKFLSPSIARKIMMNPGLHMPEGYMHGELDVVEGSIYDFLRLVEISGAEGRKMGAMTWNKKLLKLLRNIIQYNPLAAASKNARHHYDISEALYRLFLDKDMQYSCGYFENEDDTLEQAQLNKKRHIAAKLLIEPGMRVLDIGCGWGGMGIYLAEECGAEVVGVTLSPEQHRVAVSRAVASPAADRLNFLVKDYREIGGPFDRIVSVGMFEHVGIGHFDTYFNRVAELLSDDGIALIHTIARAHGPSASNPFMQKYIFPGGYSPAISEVLPPIERSGLFLSDVEILRKHYGLTCMHWRQRFQENREKAIGIYDETFARMWEFYLATSELVFSHGGYVVAQFQLNRKKHSVPQTRNYITEWEDFHRSSE
jgi:cyclopropane-fatty-acyl-phospholipid synthase